VVVRGGLHHTPHHRCGLSLAFWPPGGLTKNRLLDGVTLLSIPAQAATSALIPSINTITGGTLMDSLLTEFADLTHPAGVRHNTVHHIWSIPGLPVTCRRGDSHRISSLSPKPSSTPCCRVAQPATPRVPGRRRYTPYPRTIGCGTCGD
jgi:hypothetical protein